MYNSSITCAGHRRASALHTPQPAAHTAICITKPSRPVVKALSFSKKKPCISVRDCIVLGTIANSTAFILNRTRSNGDCAFPFPPFFRRVFYGRTKKNEIFSLLFQK